MGLATEITKFFYVVIMKIGLLTYHAVCNFGANLQTLSTVCYLKNRGYDIVVINWYPLGLENYYKKSIAAAQQHEHRKFVQEYLPVTELCRTSQDVSRVIRHNKIDCVLIGSDAVFSYIPFLRRIHLSRKTLFAISKVTPDHSFPNPFWGDFKKNIDSNIKLFAMSASAQYFDIDKCFWWTKRKIAKALNKFSIITVRDRWTQQIITNLTGSTIDITPDPVFAFNENVGCLLNKEEILSKYRLPNKYIIISFCCKKYDSIWYEELYNGLSNKGFYIVNLTMPEGCVNIKCDQKIDVPLNTVDWYYLIKYSSGYIGQRMHPMIVAFHNMVPFFIFDHYAYKKGRQQLHSSKIFDLLARANMLDCYFNIKGRKEIAPELVIENLLNFNYNNVEIFLKEYSDLYHHMMNNILKQLC